jgi:predicted nucleotide-binding protein
MGTSNDKAILNKEKKKKTTSAFPKNTLTEALKIAESIQKNNAGAPYSRLDLADSLDYSAESSIFRTLITSSSRFGLTIGGYQADKISITPLGKQIVESDETEEKSRAIKTVLLNIPLYKDFFERFDGHRVPKKEFLVNTLYKDFKIPVEDTNDCYEMIVKTARELGIIKISKDTEYFRLDLLDSGSLEKETTDANEEGEQEPQEEEQEQGALPQPKQSLQPPCTPKSPKVFISHSKNLKILSQIERILRIGQFEYEIAERTEATAIPIPEKVFGAMRNCNSAIINISADEKEKKEDQTYGINQNVLIEIGAAFLLYNRRVILLTDKRITLPSNLQGLYCSYYEGDELSFDTAMKLQEALLGFKKMD